jgi:hypothetical protein
MNAAARGQEPVERVGGVDIGIGDCGAGGRQDAGNMRRRQSGNSGKPFTAACPFAGHDERECQQRTERDPYTGAE